MYKRQIFNLLGPLANPSRPSHQLVGVSSLSILRKYQHVLGQSEQTYALIHAVDGYDEVSLTDKAKYVTNEKDSIITATDFGTQAINANDILGGANVEEASKLFLNIIKGEGTVAQNKVVCANAAIALNQIYREESLQDQYEKAMESLRSKKALSTFKKLIK